MFDFFIFYDNMFCISHIIKVNKFDDLIFILDNLISYLKIRINNFKTFYFSCVVV